MKKTFLIAGLLVGVSARTFAASAPDSAGYSLQQVIQLAIQNNVEVGLASAKTEEAKGKALQKASALLPQLMGSVSQARVFKENLESLGFEPSSGVSTLLGPFNTFDARVYLSQKVFDLSNYWKLKEGSSHVQVATLEKELVSDQVAASAALAYLEVIRARRSIETARADLALAQSLLELANDQHTAGLVTGVDVARAKTRREEANLRTLRAKTNERQATLRLARVCGLSLGSIPTLLDSLSYSSATVSTVEASLAFAEKDRSELKISEALVVEKKQSFDSARSRHAPTVSVSGDYGLNGNTYSNSEKTGSIAARMDVPLFSGRQTEGEVKEAEGRWKEAQLSEADIRRQIEVDVRLAIEMVETTAEEVQSANFSVDLAEQEMRMAEDRYKAGAGDNIQVIAAQTALAQAHEDQTNALAVYTVARINYEMSLGHIRGFSLN